MLPSRDTIHFVFDSIDLKKSINDLLDNEKHSLFRSNNKKNNNTLHNFTGVILGIEFIRLFNYTLFDFQNKQIEFYSDFTPIIMHSQNNCASQVLTSILIIVCFSNIVLLLSQYRKI